VLVSGEFEQFAFPLCRGTCRREARGLMHALVSVPYWGGTNTQSGLGAFFAVFNLHDVDQPPYTVTDMTGMFAWAAWDVSNVTKMMGMFVRALVFSQDISGWNVAAVEDVSQMFNTAIAFKQDLSAWPLSCSVVRTQFDLYANAWEPAHKPFATCS